MELPGFIPEELRQLARFVPARGWDAVEWRPMLASLRSVSWRFVSGTGVRALTRRTQAMLDRLVLAPPPREATALADLVHGAQRRSAGDRILYFRQWLVPDGLFLDLRPGRFWWSERELSTTSPTACGSELRPEFRLGIVAWRMAGVLWGIGKCIAIGGQKVIKHGSEQNLLGKMYPLVVYS